MDSKDSTEPPPRQGMRRTPATGDAQTRALLSAVLGSSPPPCLCGQDHPVDSDECD